MPRHDESLARHIAASTATPTELIRAADYYQSFDGDEDLAWAYREAFAIRVIDHPNGRKEVDIGEGLATVDAVPD